MSERPFSRYTRDKTWAALYSQCVNAGYALVPHSATNNSIAVIRCKSPAETDTVMKELLAHQADCAEFYAMRELSKDERLAKSSVSELLARARAAVILARSSDYHWYHLADYQDFAIVICGIHDSYLHLPVLEMRSNRRYAARETWLAIGSPEFATARKSSYGHNVLIGALLCGDEAARAFKATLPPRTQRRIAKEVDDLQNRRYRGRPMAFLTDAERLAVGGKISAGLKRFYAGKA